MVGREEAKTGLGRGQGGRADEVSSSWWSGGGWSGGGVEGGKRKEERGNRRGRVRKEESQRQEEGGGRCDELDGRISQRHSILMGEEWKKMINNVCTIRQRILCISLSPERPPPPLPPGRSRYCTGREPPQEPQRTRLQLRTFGAFSTFAPMAAGQAGRPCLLGDGVCGAGKDRESGHEMQG